MYEIIRQMEKDLKQHDMLLDSFACYLSLIKLLGRSYDLFSVKNPDFIGYSLHLKLYLKEVLSKVTKEPYSMKFFSTGELFDISKDIDHYFILDDLKITVVPKNKENYIAVVFTFSRLLTSSGFNVLLQQPRKYSFSIIRRKIKMPDDSLEI